MRTIAQAIAVAAMLAFGVFPSLAKASFLDGLGVDVRESLNLGVNGGIFEVGPDLEYFGTNFTVGISDDRVALYFLWPYAYDDHYPTWNGLTLSFLNFPPSSGIGDATLLSSALPGFVASERLAFDSSHLFLDFGGLHANAGSSVVVGLGPVTPAVPEPAEYLLSP